jgi:hypothetical protein
MAGATDGAVNRLKIQTEALPDFQMTNDGTPRDSEPQDTPAPLRPGLSRRCSSSTSVAPALLVVLCGCACLAFADLMEAWRASPENGGAEAANAERRGPGRLARLPSRPRKGETGPAGSQGVKPRLSGDDTVLHGGTANHRTILISTLSLPAVGLLTSRFLRFEVPPRFRGFRRCGRTVFSGPVILYLTQRTTGVRNGYVSVWTKTQASCDILHQTSA